jgi:hypothetical protein
VLGREHHVGRAEQRVGPRREDAQLDAAAAFAPITYTIVPQGTQTRIGIDRDEDGYYDADETDACSDPADVLSTPLNSRCPGQCVADITGPSGTPDGVVDAQDYLRLIGQWGTPGNCPAP